MILPAFIILSWIAIRSALTFYEKKFPETDAGQKSSDIADERI